MSNERSYSDAGEADEYSGNFCKKLRITDSESGDFRKGRNAKTYSNIFTLAKSKVDDMIMKGGSNGGGDNVAVEEEVESLLLPCTSKKRKSMEPAQEDDNVVQCEEFHKQTANCEANRCSICALGGDLLCCGGKECKMSYHLSCLDPPFDHKPFGVWYCIYCVEKKMKLGVHSVSQGPQCVLGEREVASDHEVKQVNKEYLVKYKGLAHVHNLWISERELRREASRRRLRRLLSSFIDRKQSISWKAEWTVPQRLLLKRRLSLVKHCDDDLYRNSDCHHEWLVKWTGLGYQDATWELENASFLTSSEGIGLIKDYESRHGKEEKLQSVSQSEELEREISGYKSRKANLSDKYVNKLYEHWRWGENAILFDDSPDQERVIKIISFILALQHTVWRPFLIISSALTLPVWEDEFLNVAPSVNFVVYGGNKLTRRLVRSLEFYNGNGKIMFQVLLSSYDIVSKDLEMLKSIEWRAVIFDDCQSSSFSKYCKEFQKITADSRLLVSTRVKDHSTDYSNMLSLLDSGVNGLSEDSEMPHSCTSNASIKEKLAPYVAYQCRSNSFTFVEYWVPVCLSNIQLEQYCNVLLSESLLLYSNLKSDNADAHRQIIKPIQKCCDHPYLLDSSLQSTARERYAPEEYLNNHVQVSGKLLLLEKMLMKIKSQGLRTLIIFQKPAGDILEVFVRGRFGKDCYVRIDDLGYTQSTKDAVLKYAVLNLFNSRRRGRFVFLIENRACLPSIKISFVDTIILFDSQWDPQNDLKALQRMTITPQFKNLKVFRLYSCFTLEEMILVLAREGTNVDTSDSKNWSVHLLLSGSVSLFNKLDEFHHSEVLNLGSRIYSEPSFFDDVVREFSISLQCIGENDSRSYSLLSKALQVSGKYSREILLFGEKEGDNSEQPSLFWKSLLDRKNPEWRFLPKSSQRIRKRVGFADNLGESKIRKFDFIEKFPKVCKKLRSKRKRKLVNAADKNHNILAMHPAVRDVARVTRVNTGEYLNNLPVVPEDSQLSPLEPLITRLCDALKLMEDVKRTIMTLLEYIAENYKLKWETKQTCQAFLISLCWTAASLLNYKIDRKESLLLAKQHLEFDCENDEANHIYSKLRNIKKNFLLFKTGQSVKESNHAENSETQSPKKVGMDDEELTTGFGSQRISAQLVDLEEGEIRHCADTAEFLKSASLDVALIEGEIEVSETLNTSNNTVDLEEGKIPACSNHRNVFNSNTADQQDLEEGEIPARNEDFSKSASSDHSLEEGETEGESERLYTSNNLIDLGEGEMPVYLNHCNELQVLDTVEQESVREWLDDGLKDKRDNSAGQTKMPQENLEPLQVIAEVHKEQLKVGDENLLLESSMDKMLPPEMPIDSDFETKPSVTNLSGTVLTRPMQTSGCTLKEKELCHSHVGPVYIEIESDSESDEVELVVLQDGSPNCSIHNNEVETSTPCLKDDTPGFASLETQNTNSDEHTIDSIITPSNPQSLISGEDAVNGPMHSQDMCNQNHSSMDRANASEVGKETSSVTPICIGSPLQFTRTSTVVEQPDISAVPECSIYQPTVPAVQLHASNEIQASSSSFHASNEVQASSSPFPESHNFFANELPVLSVGTRINGYDSHAHEHRTGANVYEFESIGHHLEWMRAIAMLGRHQPAPDHSLAKELERIAQECDLDCKKYTEEVFLLKFERDQEIENIEKKYEKLLQDSERAFLQKRKDHEMNYQKVNDYKSLARALLVKGLLSDIEEAEEERTVQASNPVNEFIHPSPPNPTQTSVMRPVQNSPNHQMLWG